MRSSPTNQPTLGSGADHALTPLGGLSKPVTPIPLPLSDLADVAGLPGVTVRCAPEDISNALSILLSRCTDGWVSLPSATVAAMLTTFSALAIEPNAKNDDKRAQAELNASVQFSNPQQAAKLTSSSALGLLFRVNHVIVTQSSCSLVV